MNVREIEKIRTMTPKQLERRLTQFRAMLLMTKHIADDIETRATANAVYWRMIKDGDMVRPEIDGKYDAFDDV